MTKCNINDKFKYLFDDLEDDKATIFAQEQFLRQFWDGITITDYPSFGLFAFRHSKEEKFVEQPMQITGLSSTNGLLEKYNRWDWNQYFCPNMFSQPLRQKPFARHTRLAWCDIDDADYSTFKPHPSVIWETSPERFQALWILDKKHSPIDAEAHSRALAYRHHGDNNGWPVNKLLRIPGSINHKKDYEQPFVKLLHYDDRPIKTRPRPFVIKGRSFGAKTIDVDFNHTAHNRFDILKKYRAMLDPKARSLIRDKKAYEKNRSDQIFHIVVGLHEVDATIDEIASVLWDSPYFQSKYPNDLDALQTELSRILTKIGGA